MCELCYIVVPLSSQTDLIVILISPFLRTIPPSTDWTNLPIDLGFEFNWYFNDLHLYLEHVFVASHEGLLLILTSAP